MDLMSAFMTCPDPRLAGLSEELNQVPGIVTDDDVGPLVGASGKWPERNRDIPGLESRQRLVEIRHDDAGFEDALASTSATDSAKNAPVAAIASSAGGASRLRGHQEGYDQRHQQDTWIS